MSFSLSLHSTILLSSWKFPLLLRNIVLKFDFISENPHHHCVSEVEEGLQEEIEKWHSNGTRTIQFDARFSFLPRLASLPWQYHLIFYLLRRRFHCVAVEVQLNNNQQKHVFDGNRRKKSSGKVDVSEFTTCYQRFFVFTRSLATFLW